jgi:predicted  nucleic acid-binding Zn-ribbon protein
MMSDDPGMVALLSAVVNDEAMKKRLLTIQGELEKLREARAAIETATAAHQRTLAEISAVQRALGQEKTNLETAKRDLVDEKAALTQVITNHNAERERWEAVRKTVDAEHAAREAALRDAEAEMVRIRAEHEARDRDLHHRETSVTAREHAHHRRHQAIEAALKVA